MSCHRHSATGRVWVAFETAADCETFLDIVAPYDADPGSIHQRACAWYFGQYEPVSGPLWLEAERRAAAWQFHATVIGCEVPDEKPARTEFRVGVSVLFPRSDLRVVLARMRAFNAATLTASGPG